jgi:hypothetical protein
VRYIWFKCVSKGVFEWATGVHNEAEGVTVRQTMSQKGCVLKGVSMG